MACPNASSNSKQKFLSVKSPFEMEQQHSKLLGQIKAARKKLSPPPPFDPILSAKSLFEIEQQLSKLVDQIKADRNTSLSFASTLSTKSSFERRRS